MKHVNRETTKRITENSSWKEIHAAAILSHILTGERANLNTLEKKEIHINKTIIVLTSNTPFKNQL